MISSIRSRLNRAVEEQSDGDNETQRRKFGTFAGVFVPTLLTILGVIMYLRLAWVVGNGGLVGAVAIILLAHVVTITTGLAVSSIATNIRVGAGGAFSIISQSLGLEVGGSVSVPLYLAQSVSITLYILGFTAGIINIFPGLSEAAVAFATLAVVFIIAFISARFASRVQFIILAVVILSLFSVFMGSFPSSGQEGMVYTPVLWGDFPDGDFWVVFAVFFPAVTGIMVGLSMSGDLKDPRKSIPLGTMSAIAVTMVIYLLLAYWLARVADPVLLLATDSGTIVMADKARWSWLVLAGLLGATFSSALGSMVAGPRVMQALGQHNILPRSQVFAKESEEGEPRNAMVVTGLIAFFALAFSLLAGGLNAIAPLITMFFMITYTMLNAVVLIEQVLGMVSFRPTFAIPVWVPLIGLLSCLFVMFLINPTFSLVAVILVLAIYGYLLRKRLQAPWNDVRSGLFRSIAEWAGERVARMPAAPERTWSPNILAPVTNTKTMKGSYRFLRAIAKPQGSVRALGLYNAGSLEKVSGLEDLAQTFLDEGIFAAATYLETEDFVDGIRKAIEVLSSIFFRPNILFLPLFSDNPSIDIGHLLEKTTSYRMGVVLLARHPVVELGREKLINVWVREQGPAWQLGMRLSNLDLSVLLAYQLAHNWQGKINLCMAVDDEETSEKAGHYLEELINLARLPAKTETHVLIRPFREALTEVPSADINFFGLPDEYNPDFLQEIFERVDASCLFVRDSGDESALA